LARRHSRPTATTQITLEPQHHLCWSCGGALWVAYHTIRTVATFDGLHRLNITVRSCINRTCELYRRSYRPEEEGGWALPHGEFGLDIIAHVGILRYTHHRSIPEIHRELHERGVSIAEHSVTNLLQRYEELVTLHLTDQQYLHEQFKMQGSVILALDGLQPDVGYEVLWVLRDCLSGEVLLARSLLSACEEDIVVLLREVQQSLSVPIRGSSRMDNTLFATLFTLFCQRRHTNYATSTTYGKLQNRCGLAPLQWSRGNKV